MAKKPSKYAEYRQKLINKIASAKRKGLIVRIETPKTEKQLKALGVTGKEKTAETRKLKKLISEFDKLEIIDTSTGEITSYKDIIKQRRSESAKKSAQTRKRNKEAEKKFWSGEEQQTPRNYPNGGDIIADNVIDTLINRLSTSTAEKKVDEVVEQLSQPTPETTAYEKKRRQQAYEASERERTTLLSLTFAVIARDGKSTVGWRLQARSSDVDELIIGVLYASQQEHIETASRELAEIINGSELTMSDIADLAYEQEQNEMWEMPD